MRKYGVIKVFVLILVVVLPYACGRKGVDVPELLRADRLMEEHPDSALLILQGLSHTESFSPESKAFYCLLVTEANEKNYIVHQSDSLIQIAVKFYDKSDDILHKAKAWFYWGRVSQVLLNPGKALDCYLKALNYSQEAKLYKLLGLINNYIGDVYRKLKVYDKALYYFKESCCDFEKAHDTVNIAYSYRDCGRVLMALKNVDSAFVLYSQALKLSDKYNVPVAKSTILNDLGALYRTSGDSENAICMIRRSIPLKKPHERYSSYLSLARLYYESDKLDSTEYYLKMAEPSQSVYVKEGIYNYKYKLAVKKGSYKDAIDYKEQHDYYVRSVNMYQQREKILQVTYQYNQREFEQKMKQDVAQERLVYICCIFLLLTVTAVGFYLYIRFRWSHEQVLRLKEKRIQQERKLRHQSLEQIEHNKQLIESNNLKLLNKEHDLKIAQRDLLIYNINLLKAENDLISLRREELAFRDKLFSQSELSKRIRCAGVDKRKKDIMEAPFHMRNSLI